MAHTQPEELRLLLATRRPCIQALVSYLGSGNVAIRITRWPGDGDPWDEDRALAGAAVAVVDLALDDALACCADLQAQRPELPVLALCCCPAGATADLVQVLLAAGVRGILGAEVSAPDVLRALLALAAGQLVLRCTVLPARPAAPPAAGPLLPLAERRLLELVAGGLTDQQIGRALRLSPSTVHHRLTRLHQKLRVRNRIELAAWAGSRGLYPPPEHNAGYESQAAD